MRTIPVLQVVASLVLGLFLLQLARRLSGNSSNPVVQGVNGGLDFLLG